MRRLKPQGLLLCTLALGACTGVIHSEFSGGTGNTGSGGAGSNGATGSTGGTANTGSGGSGSNSATGNTGGTGITGSGGVDSNGGTGNAGSGGADPTLAGAAVLRHLSQVEYLNTVRDLLNDTTLTTSDVPAEDPISAFDTYPFLVPDTVGATEANAYAQLATALATNLAAKITNVLPCTPTTGNTASQSACLTTFLNTFGLKAYRRPLTATEISGFQGLYQAGMTTLGLTFNGAIGLIVEEMLQSPGFLYHWEEGPSKTVHDPTNPSVIQLDPYALANRLSYFLTATMPDSTLFAAAAAGQLSTSDQVAAQAQRLLQVEQRERRGAEFRRAALPDHEPGEQLEGHQGGLPEIHSRARGGDGRGVSDVLLEQCPDRVRSLF